MKSVLCRVLVLLVLLLMVKFFLHHLPVCTYKDSLVGSGSNYSNGMGLPELSAAVGAAAVLQKPTVRLYEKAKYHQVQTDSMTKAAAANSSVLVKYQLIAP